ncbi:aminodeoxychorismate/anthranilate synthase component II [Clostridium sp. ATCC 25772]|uniref:anthranilate synthase component II n=1 Tax=Clostridium sp. ATCC 25772 TaxID=1676991 RepID=UPI000785FB4D|nr:aminodeoxychorismate/anthranilate synthase component II [Clostridium sp. ATCC 25772]
MFLMIDNYDSFVYNLVRYLEEIEEETIVFRNDKITLEKIEEINPEGIIISPGPKAPKDSGIVLDAIDRFKGKIPIFGVCLGHQSIGYAFHGNIVKGKVPVHGKINLVNHDKEGVFKNIKNPFNVTRYHSLIIEKESLPECLKITAQTEDGVIMGVRHKKYPIEGVQFHPEAELTEFGHEILKNFINNTREWNIQNR